MSLQKIIQAEHTKKAMELEARNTPKPPAPPRETIKDDEVDGETVRIDTKTGFPAMPAISTKQSKKLRGAGKIDYTRMMEWALDNISNPSVHPKDCPNIECWETLRQARMNNKEFMARWHKVLEQREVAAAEEQLHPDDQRLYDVLKGLQERVALERTQRIARESELAKEYAQGGRK